MSDASLSAGVETHRFEGVTVRVFSAAKTVADCFKFRNRIGLDVAIEALQDYVRNHGSITDLSRFAKVDRVERVMAPYVEALVS